MNIAKIRFTRGMLLRIASDVVLVNLSLLSASILKSLAFILFFSNGLAEIKIDSIDENLSGLINTLRGYQDSAIILTIICISIFSLSGFYTHGRTYRSRFKALIILQGVTISYLIFAFINYMFYSNDMFSRGVWILGWVITLVMVGGARLWSTIWRTTVSFEATMVLDSKPDKIRNILVIGGAGYLGSILIRKLLQNNYDVKILDLLMYGDSSIRDLYAYERKFQVIRGDFRNIDVIVKAMEGIDAVVHLGAIVGDPACEIDQGMTFDINLMSTKMIAEVAKGFGVQRLIFASTCSVYGANDQVISEKSELNPLSLYAKTKIASEEILQSIGQDGFMPIILRFATLYGMSYRPRFDLVINLLTAKAVCDGEITIFGGKQWRPFVHVADAAEAVMKCINIPFFSGSNNVYNVGSNSQNYQIYRIGEILKKTRPNIKVIHVEEDTDPRNYNVSFSRIQNALGFEPKYSVEDGIIEICESFEHGLIVDYRDSKYNNYKFLSEDHCFARFKFDLVPKSLFMDSLSVRASEGR